MIALSIAVLTLGVSVLGMWVREGETRRLLEEADQRAVAFARLTDRLVEELSNRVRKCEGGLK